jgi:hypothetical protein
MRGSPGCGSPPLPRPQTACASCAAVMNARPERPRHLPSPPYALLLRGSAPLPQFRRGDQPLNSLNPNGCSIAPEYLSVKLDVTLLTRLNCALVEQSDEEGFILVRSRDIARRRRVSPAEGATREDRPFLRCTSSEMIQ